MNPATIAFMFAKYVPREVIKQLILSDKEISLGGEKNEITIFFSDITNFTTFSESLDTEFLLKSLTEYFDGLSRIILTKEGIIDKYIGDSIMAFWGAPLQKPDHAILACETSLLCDEFIKNFNIKQKEQDKPQFFTRFGINTGTVIVGNIGTLARMNYTAMGDSVNIAARLQTVNKIYGTTIIISDAVYNKICHADFILRPLDIIEVKGKKYKIKIYELRGKITKDSTSTSAHDITFCQLFTEGFELFHKNEYRQAQLIFAELLSTYPNDVPTQLYIERIKPWV